MGEEDIGVAVPAHSQGGPGSHGDGLHLDAGLSAENGEEAIEKSRVSDTRGGGQKDRASRQRFLRRWGQARQTEGKEGDCVFHGWGVLEFGRPAKNGLAVDPVGCFYFAIAEKSTTSVSGLVILPSGNMNRQKTIPKARPSVSSQLGRPGSR